MYQGPPAGAYQQPVSYPPGGQPYPPSSSSAYPAPPPPYQEQAPHPSAHQQQPGVHRDSSCDSMSCKTCCRISLMSCKTLLILCI